MIACFEKNPHIYRVFRNILCEFSKCDFCILSCPKPQNQGYKGEPLATFRSFGRSKEHILWKLHFCLPKSAKRHTRAPCVSVVWWLRMSIFLAFAMKYWQFALAPATYHAFVGFSPFANYSFQNQNTWFYKTFQIPGKPICEISIFLSTTGFFSNNTKMGIEFWFFSNLQW